MVVNSLTECSKMPDIKSRAAVQTLDANSYAQDTKSALDAPFWETPKIEDVSEQVMAQPYIRFT